MEKFLLEYYRACDKLECVGGPTKAPYLFEEIINMEKDICSGFGLRPCISVLRTFRRTDSTNITSEEIEQIIFRMEKMAIARLSGDIPSRLEKLRIAQESSLVNPFELLPDIGFFTHIYTIYLINKMLLEENEPAEKILNELEISKDYLSDIGSLIITKNTWSCPNSNGLNTAGLIYLDSYVDFIRKFQPNRTDDSGRYKKMI